MYCAIGYTAPADHPRNTMLNTRNPQIPLLVHYTGAALPYRYVPHMLNTQLASVDVLNWIIYIFDRPVITPPSPRTPVSSFHTLIAMPVCITFSKHDSPSISSSRMCSLCFTFVINIRFSLPSPCILCGVLSDDISRTCDVRGCGIDVGARDIRCGGMAPSVGVDGPTEID